MPGPRGIKTALTQGPCRAENRATALLRPSWGHEVEEGEGSARSLDHVCSPPFLFLCHHFEETKQDLSPFI